MVDARQERVGQTDAQGKRARFVRSRVHGGHRAVSLSRTDLAIGQSRLGH
jgi:hypothetical protein